MARLAWFAPSPSDSIKCICHNLDLVTRLETNHRIDFFCENAHPPPSKLSSAHDFIWKHLDNPYDLTIYELADLNPYAFIWPYLVRYPGLVALHDGRLHHSRGEALLKQVRIDDYQAEFGYNHPNASRDIPRLAHAELLGPAKELWPMRRVVVESSRLLLAPNEWIANEIREEASHDRIDVLEPGLQSMDFSESADAQAVSARVRQRYGIRAEDIVFMAIDSDSKQNRIRAILSAFSQLHNPERAVRLLLVGESTLTCAEPDGVTRTGNLDDQDFQNHLYATDVYLSLQWPDRSDGMRSWLTAMATAKPTVIVDYSHLVNVPSIDPRDWKIRKLASPVAETVELDRDPVCVTVDMVDEEHSLKLVFRRLTKDSQLRLTLGKNAKKLWSNHFSAHRIAKNIEEAVTRALTIPPGSVNRSNFPPHLLTDGSDNLRSDLRKFGLVIERLGLDL